MDYETHKFNTSKYLNLGKVQPMNVDVTQSTPWEEVGNTPEQDRIRNIYDEVYTQTPEALKWNDYLQAVHMDDEDEFDDEIVDISDEEYRRYVFDRDRDVMILFPQFLHIDGDTGEHMIIDREDVVHHIPYTWIKIEMEYLHV